MVDRPMAIAVKYFASLKETLGKAEEVLEILPGQSVNDVWVQANADQSSIPDGILCAVNHVYATAETQVHDGDEVAFFPPVTGG